MKSLAPGIQMQLCVVKHITVEMISKPVAQGGELSVIHDWDPRESKHKLQCITYRCELG